MDAFNSGVNALFETTRLDPSTSPSSCLLSSAPAASVNSVSYSVIQSPIRSKIKESTTLSSSLFSSSSSSSSSCEVENVNYRNANSYKEDDAYQQSQHDSQMFAYDDCKNSSSSSSSSSSLSMPLLSPQYARVNRVVLDKNSDEYRKRRERNNIAVKKSR